MSNAFWMIALGSLGLVLAACGKSEEKPSAPPATMDKPAEPPAAETPPPAAPPPAQPADTELQKKRSDLEALIAEKKKRADELAEKLKNPAALLGSDASALKAEWEKIKQEIADLQAQLAALAK